MMVVTKMYKGGGRGKRRRWQQELSDSPFAQMHRPYKAL